MGSKAALLCRVPVDVNQISFVLKFYAENPIDCASILIRRHASYDLSQFYGNNMNIFC